MYTVSFQFFNHVFYTAVACGKPAIPPSVDLPGSDPSRIVGGDRALPHSWPWQLFLLMDGEYLTHDPI